MDKDWLELINAKGTPIVDRLLEENEEIHVGSKVWFPSNIATIRSCVVSLGICDPAPLLDVDASSMVVHAALATGLDFSYGSRFKADIKRIFGIPVHPLGEVRSLPNGCLVWSGKIQAPKCLCQFGIGIMSGGFI
jgi:hypothetical protein